MGRFARIIIAGSALAGCQTGQPPALSVDVHTMMVDWIDPAAVVIWDISSRTMGEASGSEHKRMNEKSWSRLEGAARQLALQAHRLADVSTINVGGSTELLEGISGPEIQAKIDADPDEFRRLAQQAAQHAENLAAAAGQRDLERSQALTKSLYDNCLACHSRYWKAPAP